MNTWTFTGRVFYLKEMEGDYSCSIKMKGSTNESTFKKDIVEFGCLLPKEVWNAAKNKGLCVNSKVTLSGHFETWVKPRSTYFINKTMFIADCVVDVE